MDISALLAIIPHRTISDTSDEMRILSPLAPIGVVVPSTAAGHGLVAAERLARATALAEQISAAMSFEGRPDRTVHLARRTGDITGRLMVHPARFEPQAARLMFSEGQLADRSEAAAAEHPRIVDRLAVAPTVDTTSGTEDHSAAGRMAASRVVTVEALAAVLAAASPAGVAAAVTSAAPPTVAVAAVVTTIDL